MFYCEPCQRKKKWPISAALSAGTCELCNKYSVCYDVPSSQLPKPEEKKK